MAPTPSSRKTFVVSLREQDGPATVHEVRTGRKARLTSLREIAGQIEGWLREAKPRGREGNGTGGKR
ncbi:MAG: hypothetical protein ACRDL6_01270 [Solirubrobacterales bacterium]